MKLNIALAPINATVGDLEGNKEKIRQAAQESQDCDLILFPELALCGYPPGDLLLKPSFIEACHKTLDEIAHETKQGPDLLVGAPWLDRKTGVLYNAVVHLSKGKQKPLYKHKLANYEVFDEKRWFGDGILPDPIECGGAKIGVVVCEDIWHDTVTNHLKEQGAELILVANASPYAKGRMQTRLDIVRQRVKETGLPIAYLNLFGGQDEYVYDGCRFVICPDQDMVVQGQSWECATTQIVFSKNQKGAWRPDQGDVIIHPGHLEDTWWAMKLALKDYVHKNGFGDSGVVLGLSGGIDSALVAALAVDALGAGKVMCVMMPSPYTSATSMDDASHNAELLGCSLERAAIHGAMKAMNDIFDPFFEGLEADLTEENIQARLRGVILMGLSNKLGKMVLATGNKSELAVGYATLYGDMCGGYAPLKDVLKKDVYALAKWRNEVGKAIGHGPAGKVIPENILTKAPTAELRPNQKDEDSLPPYDVLDQILEDLLEKDQSRTQIIELGADAQIVNRVCHLVQINEYKRFQAAPGVRLNLRSFCNERRYPLTNGYVG